MSGFGEEIATEKIYPISPRRRKLASRPVEIGRERKSGPRAGGSVGGETGVAEDSFPVMRRLRRMVAGGVLGVGEIDRWESDGEVGRERGRDGGRERAREGR